MHWDTTKIRNLADRMEMRTRGFSVSAVTTPLIVTALRFYAREGLAEQIKDLAYGIDVWDESGNNLIEHVGRIGDLAVARVAYRQTLAERPGKQVTMRQGIRVVMSTERRDP